MHATRSLWMCGLIAFAILVFLQQHAVTSTSYQYADTHDPQPQRHRRATVSDYQRTPQQGRQPKHQAGGHIYVDGNLHKCRIWVPVETVPKYKWASEIQKDNVGNQVQIEVCCEGYAPMRWAGRTVCQPVCDNCENGSCESPGVCKCYEGFVRNDNGDCVFTCPLGCLNGVCYLDGTCECANGYKLDESRKFCRPICSDGCGLYAGTNCTEPERCACSKGYRLTQDGCQPTCQPSCGEGGFCVGHNKCQCQAGYTLTDGVCQSHCYQKCTNGYCYTPNRCICKPGYTYHEATTSCVPI